MPVSSAADHEGEVKKPWWKIGYKRLGAVLSALGIVFALAQLPGKLEGLAGTIKDDLNLINTKRHPGSVVTFDRIGRFQFTKDRSLGGAIRAFGRPTSKDPARSPGQGAVIASCLVRWEDKGVTADFIATAGSACSAQYGYLCAAEIDGSDWKTATGLRVGDSIERLRSLYPSVDSSGPINNRAWQLEKGAGGCPDRTIARNAGRGGLYAITAVEAVVRFEVTYLTLAE